MKRFQVILTDEKLPCDPLLGQSDGTAPRPPIFFAGVQRQSCPVRACRHADSACAVLPLKASQHAQTQRQHQHRFFLRHLVFSRGQCET